MARMIDADRLLRELTELSHGQVWPGWTYDGIRLLIERQPTLTPPNEWVSVEERLPEYNPGTGAKSYWVAKKDNAGNWQMKIAQYCDYGYAMTVDAETEVTWRDWDFTKIVNVTHWMPLPAPPGKDNNVPTNEPLTLEQLREMDGEPVWVEDVKHWALIDIEKGGQWDGVPFAIWAENGTKFTYNVESRGLHCYRRPPEGEEDT